MSRHLTLPYPPSANRYWRSFRGRVVKSAAAKAYQAGVRLTHRADPVTGPVAVSLAVYRPARRGDLDNSIKVLLDALKGVAFVDDAQVVAIYATRFDDKARPRVEVVVDEVTG